MANIEVIANGGHLIHLLPQGGKTSLCGHTPKHTAHLMKQRGRWRQLRENYDLKGTGFRHCEKCAARAFKSKNRPSDATTP